MFVKYVAWIGSKEQVSSEIDIHVPYPFLTSHLGYEELVNRVSRIY